MRITRGKTFQNKDGSWDKVEVVLGFDDLPSVILEATPASHHPDLLNLKAERVLTTMMQKTGQFDEVSIREQLKSIDDQLTKLPKKVAPKVTLKRRHPDD